MNATDERPILVGVDGSDASVEALRYAARVAAAFDAPIEAITTWEYPIMPDGYYPIEEWSPEQDARQILDATLERAFAGSPPARLTSTTLAGPPARVLVHESHRAAMLVLGSRGHGGLAALLLGSVSAACAAHAHCPVLITHGDRAPEAEVDGHR